MSDYAKGKIYKITSPKTSNIYIGSTIKELSRRFGSHLSDYKKWKISGTRYQSSFEILNHGEAIIELIELFPCSGKVELNAREHFHMDMNNAICINKRRSYCNLLPMTRFEMELEKSREKQLDLKKKRDKIFNNKTLEFQKKLELHINRNKISQEINPIILQENINDENIDL